MGDSETSISGEQPDRGEPSHRQVSALRRLLSHRPFTLYLTSTLMQQLAADALFVTALYHMHLLSGSTVMVGMVGLSKGVASIVLAPPGGYLADRVDRKRLLQVCQAASFVLGSSMAALTIIGVIRPWHLLAAIFLHSAVKTFEDPVRKVIITDVVPAGALVRAFSVINPVGQFGKLAGPAVGGGLIALGGPHLVYLFDALIFIALIAIVGRLPISRLVRDQRAGRMLQSLGEGLTYFRTQRVLIHLIGLDVAANLFTAYRVLLPAIALDVLGVGAAGYGLLAAAPAAGAVFGGVLSYRLAGVSSPSGIISLVGTMMMGLSALMLAASTTLAAALFATGIFGVGNAVATVVRHAALLVETPDRLRGRVSAIYGISAKGGSAVGEFNVGLMASLLGVSGALVLGGVVPLAYVALIASTSRSVRGYRTTT